MKKHIYWIFSIALLSLAFVESGKEYPKGYFRLPVNHTPRISGTFGELRPNHFHAGIDIKSSSGKPGDPIFAAADGHISRIKVQPGGYGQALYMDHPNGYTTVYAHLDAFPDVIAEYVARKQEEQQSFSVDLQPPAHLFSYDKGQKIGTMGNTGRSFGPHLHFELRHTVTEEPINPLLFGLPIQDNQHPALHQIKVYPLNAKNEPVRPFVKNIGKGKGGQYYVGGDTLVVDAWRMGLGIKAYDHSNGVSNWNGVYGIETYLDGRLIHQTQFEKFHFKDTRYLNAHADYRERLRNKAWFNRCYRMPGNQLPIYPVLENDGVIPLHSKTQQVRIVVYDAYDHAAEVTFWVKKAPEVRPAEQVPYNYLLPHSEDSYVQRPDLYLHFPKGALYENLYLQYEQLPDASSDAYSATHILHDEETPIHQWYTIGIRPQNIPEGLRHKAVIALCRETGKPISHGGYWDGDMLKAEARDLGRFCVMLDDEPPRITPTVFQRNLKGYSKIQFKLSDNFETSKKLASYTWKGFIDGRWVLFTPNPSESLITHRFSKSLPPGEHTLLLEAVDERGNRAVFEQPFLR